MDNLRLQIRGIRDQVLSQQKDQCGSGRGARLFQDGVRKAQSAHSPIDVWDAFARFVGKGQKYYVPRTTIDIDTSVEAVVASGGVPVLAHPFQYKKSDGELRELIERCMDHGLRGIECRYSGYDAQQVAYLEGLAEKYGLLKTGGSDFHGENKPHISLGTGIGGELDVPYEWLEKLKEAAGL